MTKKILFGMMAATMMFATSCENELDLGTNVGETAQVTFSVGTPEIATRAFSDGKTATVLQYAVYDAEGNELPDLTKSVAKGNAEEILGSTTVNLQLTTNNTYSVIFWAAAENAPYNVDLTKKTMTVDYTAAVSNDEARDAFYKYHTFTVKGAQTETIGLKRPFAQLNIGTSDFAASKSAGYTPAYSYVKVPVYNTLDLVEGKVSTVNGADTSEDAVATEFKLAAIPQNETFPIDGYDYISMNYLLVAADKEVVDVEFGYSENSQSVEKTRTVGSVPVQRNYRTNLYGQLLTSDVDVNVEILPPYDKPAHEADELLLAAAVGGKVTLTDDVVLTKPLNVVAGMVLNLNGHTIKGDGISNDAVISADGATLTIKGDGTITTTGAYPLGVKNGGTLVVEGGNYTATNSTQALYVWKGTANINGGYFEVDSKYNGTSYTDDNGNGRYVLNCLDTPYKNGTAKIVVTGGTFYNFDPANNAAEGANTNFCAEGYASSKVGDKYIVAEEGKRFVLTAQDFEDALADPDVDEIILTDDVTLDGGLTFGAAVSTLSTRSASTTLAGRDIVIDGNGSTISFESVPSGRLIDVRKEAVGINFTLKNVTLLNNVSWVERGINYNTNGTLTLDNVTIKSAENCLINYAVNLPANSANATVIIKDSNIGATSNALNLWGEKTTVNVTNSDLYIIDNNEKESYAVIALNNDGTNIADYSVVTVTGGSVKVTGSYPGESNAVRNSTINGKVEISETTEVVGLIQEYTAIVYYEGYDNFYSFTTLQSALDKVANDATAAGVRMLRSTNEFAVNNKAPYGNYYGVKHDGFTLDGNGNTLDFELGELNDKNQADNYGIMTSGGTIKNMTITGVFRGIMIMNPTETVNIDNVTIGDKDVCYAINTGEGDGTQDLVVTNSTIKGWSSYGTAIKSVSFKECTFAQGEYYKDVFGRLVKPYVDCVFENCEFGSKFYIDLSALTTDGDGNVVNPDAKVTLKNCTVNGVKLTKDNWVQLIAAENSCGEGQISIELKDGSYLTEHNVVDYVVFE